MGAQGKRRRRLSGSPSQSLFAGEFAFGSAKRESGCGTCVSELNIGLGGCKGAFAVSATGLGSLRGKNCHCDM